MRCMTIFFFSILKLYKFGTFKIPGLEKEKTSKKIVALTIQNKLEVCKIIKNNAQSLFNGAVWYK